MSVDPSRHRRIFDPDEFGSKRVDVIGCGATGSRVALSLAKLGVTNLHVWDFDTVEEHNIANQAFNLDDVGYRKVEVMSDLIEAATGVEMGERAHNERVDGSQPLGDVVFLLTDTMKSRREIWEKALRYKAGTGLVVETRLDVDNGRVYAIQPFKREDVKLWEESLCSDDEAEPSACARLSIGPTAEVVSGLAVWAMLQWWGWVNGKNEAPDREQIFAIRPSMIAMNVR